MIGLDGTRRRRRRQDASLQLTPIRFPRIYPMFLRDAHIHAHRFFPLRTMTRIYQIFYVFLHFFSSFQIHNIKQLEKLFDHTSNRTQFNCPARSQIITLDVRNCHGSSYKNSRCVRHCSFNFLLIVPSCFYI